MSGTRRIGAAPMHSQGPSQATPQHGKRTFNGPRFCRNPDFDLPCLAALIPVRPRATRALSATTADVSSGFPALSLAREPGASARSIVAAIRQAARVARDWATTPSHSASSGAHVIMKGRGEVASVAGTGRAERCPRAALALLVASVLSHVRLAAGIQFRQAPLWQYRAHCRRLHLRASAPLR